MKRRNNMMKRRARAQMIGLIVILTVLLMLSSYIDTRYTREATVDSINGTTVEFVDTLGYTWTATDVDNVVEGQTVVLKMYTNNTNSIITDDKIIKIEPTKITVQ